MLKLPKANAFGAVVFFRGFLISEYFFSAPSAFSAVKK